MSKFSAVATMSALSLALMLGACTTDKPTNTAQPPVAGESGPPPSSGSTIVPGSAEDLRVNVGDTVHFGYNEYNIEEADRAILQRQATWLQKYPSVRVTVEGDCDERGTREYNLALGERRAQAVKNVLVAMGLPASRISTISYGKERPAVVGSSEDAYAQNRRAVTTVN